MSKRQQWLSFNNKRRHIFNCWFPDLNYGPRSGKWKYCILLGVDSDRDRLYFVLINTKEYGAIYGRADAEGHPLLRDVLNAQVVLRSKDYPFLRYDSSANCASLVQKTRSEFRKELEDCPQAEIDGKLNDHDCTRIINNLYKYADLTDREHRIISGL
ncbi:MAG: hypothetical protein ACLP5H_08860 [Desulfomonilaceae bacterium]